MIDSGEDPLFIARRLVISAAEDIMTNVVLDDNLIIMKDEFVNVYWPMFELN